MSRQLRITPVSDAARAAEAAATAQAWVRAVDLVDRIVADLRVEADKWNQKSLVPGTADELRRRYLKLHEELRRLANKYEKLADKMDDSWNVRTE